MFIETLHPDLLTALAAVDRGEVRIVYVGLAKRRIWFVADRPNTPAIHCLLDGGLIEEDCECQPPVALTDAGRALLDTLNQTKEA